MSWRARRCRHDKDRIAGVLSIARQAHHDIAQGNRYDTGGARALGVSQQTVFAYELGDRRMSVLLVIKLARIFDLSVEQLAGMTVPLRPRRRLSPAGLRHAERYQMLRKTQQRFVARIIDVLLMQNSPQLSVSSN